MVPVFAEGWLLGKYDVLSWLMDAGVRLGCHVGGRGVGGMGGVGGVTG